MGMANPQPNHPPLKVGSKVTLLIAGEKGDDLPICDWCEGDTLEVLAFRQVEGYVLPVFWNIRAQDAASLLPEWYGKPMYEVIA